MENVQATRTPLVDAATEEVDAADDLARRLGQAALRASVMPGVPEEEQSQRWKAAVNAASMAIAAEKRLISARRAVADEERSARALSAP